MSSPARARTRGANQFPPPGRSRDSVVLTAPPMMISEGDQRIQGRSAARPLVPLLGRPRVGASALSSAGTEHSGRGVREHPRWQGAAPHHSPTTPCSETDPQCGARIRASRVGAVTASRRIPAFATAREAQRSACLQLSLAQRQWRATRVAREIEKLKERARRGGGTVFLQSTEQVHAGHEMSPPDARSASLLADFRYRPGSEARQPDVRRRI